MLAAMAEGKPNLSLARSLIISRAAVENDVTAIFGTLTRASTEHRRVQAVLTFWRPPRNRP